MGHPSGAPSGEGRGLSRSAHRVADEILTAPASQPKHLAREWPDLALALADLLDELRVEVPLAWLEVRHP